MTFPIYETKKIGKFTVQVVYDDTGRDLSDAINDEPVMIFEGGRWGNHSLILDQSKRNFPGMDFMKAHCESDVSECLNLLCDSRYLESRKAESGRFYIEHPDFESARNGNGRRYFKTEQSALAALFLAEHGRPLSDLRVESFGGRSDTYYLCFWQSEFDSYCGGKNCKSSLSECQAIIDGEVYGFEVIRKGETVESCWGFIGCPDYCMDEGVGIATHLEKKRAEKKAAKIARKIEAARPDMVAH